MHSFKIVSLIFLIGGFFYFAYLYFVGGEYLRFSDGAKFGLVAKNIIENKGYSIDFSFFSQNIFNGKVDVFSASAIPMAMPLSIAVGFRIFGINDSVIILTSGFYYFLLLLSVYFLGKKVYGEVVGFLAAIALAANLNFLDYATSGASELLFCASTVLSFYLIYIKNRWTNILFFLSLVALYVIRPQAIVFIVILLFSWLIKRFNLKKTLTLSLAVAAGILTFDWFVLYPLSYSYPVYPITIRGIQAIFQYSPASATSNALRGEAANVVMFADVLKKVFYNLYNFYKALPQIGNPYLWTLAFLSLFFWKRPETDKNILKFAMALIVVGMFALAAMTIPFYRYLHPVIPFVYVVAIGTLKQIMEKFVDRKYVALTTSLLIIFFTLGQPVGEIFLDSRFSSRLQNRGKPPAYVNLAKELENQTKKEDLVVTNLDTWGSWYGQRRTVWFPLEPKMLLDTKTQKTPFDAIYLTDYRVNDENYYMSASWKSIFDNPNNPDKWQCEGCAKLAEEFAYAGSFKFSAEDNLEKETAASVLLIKKRIK